MKDLNKKIEIPDILKLYEYKNKSLFDCDKKELLAALKEALNEVERLEVLNRNKPYSPPYYPPDPIRFGEVFCGDIAYLNDGQMNDLCKRS